MPLGAVARFGEGVEEDDDVGVPLGVRLVDPRLAPPRGRAPVDAANAVAGHERPQVGELDPLAADARCLAARERLRLERAQQAVELLAARIDLQRPRQLELLLEDEQPEAVLRAQEEVADQIGAPALATQRIRELRLVAVVEPQEPRVRGLGREPVREVEQQLQLRDRVLGPQLEQCLDRLALDLALGVQLEERAHLRRLGERQADDQQERERRRQRGRLGPAEDERRDQAEGGEPGVRAELRRRRAGHSAAGSGAGSGAGVGTRSSSSSTMSSGRSRCTQSSGRSESRCARAGTATAFTSSGVT